MMIANRAKVRRRGALPLCMLTLMISCSLAFHSTLQRSFHRRPLDTTVSIPGTGTSLYGIKGFRAWFESEFPDSTVSINADTAQERFDHVLLDMNEILHVVLRRSRSEEHAVRILMSELDRILNVAVPSKSLVLAIDGAPAAAKLATQRRRRYGTLVRTEWKIQHFDKLRVSKRKRAKKLRNYNSELQSLQITPGTDFQKLMENSLLYWAWQRLQSRNGKFRDVRIYISPSTVAGEGEVKLLEWVLQKPREGDSLAVFGRDSDLLLESLIIPPYWTHNVFVIQEESPTRYLSVSLWETTRKLQSWLPSDAPPEQILQLRTDLVLLMILNGNDYFPKLRGIRGFSNICRIYRKLVAEATKKRNKNGGPDDIESIPGLVHPDTLDFRIDFCISFFEEIAKIDVRNSNEEKAMQSSSSPVEKRNALDKLNSYLDAGFLPKPKKFQIVSHGRQDAKETSVDDTVEELDDDDDDDDDDNDYDGGDFQINDDKFASAENTDQVLVRLSLGYPDSDDFFQYEVWGTKAEAKREAKHVLATMAIEDILGSDFLPSSDMDMELGISNTGYSWEISNAIEGKVDRYLGGLLWNLQTYQDGTCPDYNFNYGRRQSPTASKIVKFFKQAKVEKRSVGRRDLLGEDFGAPISAGLSCLAALPSQVRHLIPEPYCWLEEATVEAYYEEAMDPEDNSLDIKLFEKRCEAEIERIRLERGLVIPNVDQNEPHGRRIVKGDHWWTVLGRTRAPLAHPFDPPLPPTENFAELWSNPRIRVSRVLATSGPRPRSVWGDVPPKDRSRRNKLIEIRHSSLGDFLHSSTNLMKKPYKIDYKKQRSALSKTKKTEKASRPDLATVELDDFEARLQHFNKTMPPPVPATNTEGCTALMSLSQLHDLQMIGPIRFNLTFPSQSSYASWNPQNYESFVLTIEPSDSSVNSILNHTLTFSQDRDVQRQSKQAIKQHLCDLALTKIFGPKFNWTKLSFADLRWILKGQTGANSSQGQSENSIDKSLTLIVVKSSKDGQTALACLKQLYQIGLIGEIEFMYNATSTEKSSGSGGYEIVSLTVGPSADETKRLNEKELQLTYERNKGVISRQHAKQHLAALALGKIVGQGYNWQRKSFKFMRRDLLNKAAERWHKEGRK